MPQRLGSKGTAPPRASVPIVPILQVPVDRDAMRRVHRLAEEVLREEPEIGRTDVFGPRVSAGLGDGPALLIGDQREMAMKPAAGLPMLEHRMALLGRRGDILTVERQSESFFHLLDRLLPEGAPRSIELGPPNLRGLRSMAARCVEAPKVLSALLYLARENQEIQIIPHIGTGWTWVLGGKIAAQSACCVRIAAPPPRLSNRVNDKLWFARRAEQLLGRNSIPLSYAASGPAGVAGHLKRMAERASRLVLKVPDGSGGEGNIALLAADVLALSANDLRDLVIGTLRQRGWNGAFPLLVGVWDVDASSSPSVQIWIPPEREGDPVIDGIFEQRIAGRDGTFIGAVPAELEPEVLATLASEATILALFFQRLGYVGRCSFDALVVGSGSRRIHWIECNGRWGGVSVPLVAGHRIRRPRSLSGLVIVQDDALPLRFDGFDTNIDALGDLVFNPRSGRGIVPLSSAMFDRGKGVHVAALADTQTEAEELTAKALARLWTH